MRKGRHRSRFGCGCHNARQDRFIEPSLLLLLWDKPRHGYELMTELPNLGFHRTAADPAAVYRNLRHLEEYGLVISEWDTSGTGPAKRLYRITDAGKEYLHTWIDVLRQRRDALSEFLSAYEKVSGIETK